MKKTKPKRPAASKRSSYKVTNWKQYNQALKQRGSLQVWLPKELEELWYYQGTSQKGAQFQYSDTCIEIACIIKQVYQLPYRQTQGFLESLVEILGWKVKVPDYTVMHRRHKALQLKFPPSDSESLYLVVDSTGMKVYGEGEWKVRQHGYSKHRTWRKVHLAVNESTGEIKSCAMTTNSVDDAAMIVPLLNQIEGKVKKLAADGAYDKKKVYKELEERKIQAVIPPRKGARIEKHGNSKGKELQRDKAIRSIRKTSRKAWKKKVGYHRRSIVESSMFRLKKMFGDKLYSRLIEHQEVEVKMKCIILNKMAKQGMPISIKTKLTG